MLSIHPVEEALRAFAEDCTDVWPMRSMEIPGQENNQLVEEQNIQKGRYKKWKEQRAEKKAKKVDVVYDSYQAALRYLRKKHDGEKFLSWKALGLDAKEQWNEFATTKLSEGMNKDLKRDLIVAAADAVYEQLKA